MANKKRVRRKLRRKAPAIRRSQSQGLGQAARGAASDLMVGGVMDPAEKSADVMADRALSHSGPTAAIGPAPSGALHRKCAECAAEDDGKEVKRATTSAPITAPGAASAPASKSAAHAVGAMGAGRLMSRHERAFFEPRFGRDFSDVRIHEGASAARATRALDARAFAHGSDIAFAPGERTRRNMAHELAHVVQDDGVARRIIHRRAHTDCDDTQQASIEAAETRAITMLTNAIALLTADPVSSATQTAFANHFGGYGTWRRDVVVGHYRNILRHLNDASSFDYQCEEPLAEQCSANTLGFTYWVFGDVHICAPWHSRSLDSQASTIVHELMHLTVGSLDLGYHENDADNERYWLAAVNNADSFSELLEDLN